MQEINVISLLSGYSADVIVGAVIACLSTLVLKLFFRKNTKFFMFVSFVSAAAITALISCFAIGSGIVESVSGGLTAGALAILLTAFIKRLAFTDDDELKKNLEKLLSTIILSDNLDEVVNEVIERLVNDKTVDKRAIKSLLGEVVESKTDEETLDNLTDFIYDLIKKDNKDD